MNAKELLRQQLDDAGYQISQVLKDLPDFALDHKVTPHAMSPREIVEHLAEAYEALRAHLEGRKHAWGTFRLPDHRWDAMLAEMAAIRGRSVEATLASDDPEALTAASAYITSHDAYHVGQLVLLRLELTPDWDVHSIYR